MAFMNVVLVAWMYCVMLIAGVAAQEQCTDLRGRLISHGLHYVPGPDTCTLCVCDNGLPKVCKAVLCSPPQVSQYSVTLFYLGINSIKLAILIH